MFVKNAVVERRMLHIQEAYASLGGDYSARRGTVRKNGFFIGDKGRIGCMCF